ncbi:hypothetical protein MTO96_027007 [Rhipicephalus appendiculatus]
MAGSSREYRFTRLLYAVTRMSRPLLVVVLSQSLFVCYLILTGRKSGQASLPPEGFSRIFFLETGRHGPLTARVACAVESAAKLHPEWTVHLLSAEAGGDASHANVTLTGPFARMIRSIPNVVASVIRPREVFQGTPLGPWYESGILKKSAFPVQHLADALRLAENGDSVSNGFLGFRRGDPFLLYLMQRVRRVYNPQFWNSIGPRLWRQVTLERCGARHVNELLGRKCGGEDTGFTVLPHWMFLPVPYDRWELFFVANASREAWLLSSASYFMHVYNKMSSKVSTVPGCAYRQAAETYCPDSLRMSLEMLGTF